ncbi:hypothetical protein SK128_011199, partial [Halocaridina rubra]
VSSQVMVDLYNHLACSLTEGDECLGEDGKVQLTKDDDEKVLNLMQDILGCLSIKPLPKHIGVAVHILKQIYNKSLATMISKFEHCISYPNAQRHIETAANDVSE